MNLPHILTGFLSGDTAEQAAEKGIRALAKLCSDLESYKRAYEHEREINTGLNGQLTQAEQTIHELRTHNAQLIAAQARAEVHIRGFLSYAGNVAGDVRTGREIAAESPEGVSAAEMAARLAPERAQQQLAKPQPHQQPTAQQERVQAAA